jgi:hypothetical protein
MVDGVDLPKIGLSMLLACIKSADRDAAFKGIHRFCEAFPLNLRACLSFLRPRYISF